MTDKPSEMVESLAKAIFRSQYAHTTAIWEGSNEIQRNGYREDARAALSAIEGMGYVIVPREPTEAMIFAAYTSGDDITQVPRKELKAALSAALAEGKHEASPPKA